MSANNVFEWVHFFLFPHFLQKEVVLSFSRWYSRDSHYNQGRNVCQTTTCRLSAAKIFFFMRIATSKFVVKGIVRRKFFSSSIKEVLWSLRKVAKIFVKNLNKKWTSLVTEPAIIVVTAFSSQKIRKENALGEVQPQSLLPRYTQMDGLYRSLPWREILLTNQHANVCKLIQEYQIWEKRFINDWLLKTINITRQNRGACKSVTLNRTVWFSSKIKENFSVYGLQPPKNKHLLNYGYKLSRWTFKKALQNLQFL